MNSGMAVSASLKLWMVSATRAIEPEMTMTHELQRRGDQERDEGDLDGTDASSRRFERGVDGVGGVVAVRREDP